MRHQGTARPEARRLVTTVAAIIVAAAIAAGVIIYNRSAEHHRAAAGQAAARRPRPTWGCTRTGVPDSYAGVAAFTSATGAKPDVVMYYSGWFVPFPTEVRHHGGQQRSGAAGPTGPGRRQHRRDRGRALRRLPEPVRRGRPGLPAPGHPELRARDERRLVLVGVQEHVAGGVRGRLAARRHPVPRAGSQERDLAVDGQHHQRHAARPDPAPEPVVAGRLLRELGRHRRLLPQADLEVRAPVRADHRGRAPAHHRPDPDRRDGRGADRRPAREDQRPVRRHPPVRAARVRVVRLDQQQHQNFGIDSPAAIAAFRRGASTYTRPGS